MKRRLIFKTQSKYSNYMPETAWREKSTWTKFFHE